MVRCSGRSLTLNVARHHPPTQVRSLTLLEPFDALRAPLRTAVQKARLDSKAKILPIGIEKRSELAAKGVRPGTYDTVVLGESRSICSHIAYIELIQLYRSQCKYSVPFQTHNRTSSISSRC